MPDRHYRASAGGRKSGSEKIGLNRITVMARPPNRIVADESRGSHAASRSISVRPLKVGSTARDASGSVVWSIMNHIVVDSSATPAFRAYYRRDRGVS